MIDRKTLGILILLVLAMTAAAVWRLSQLPDWTQVTFPGPHGPHTKPGLILFFIPACGLFMIAVAFGSKWLVSGPDEAIEAHQRRNRLMLVGTGVILAVAQTFMISRSFWLALDVDADLLARGTIMVSAILMMMQGNNMPKLPWISSRFPALQLDPWQQARARRFAGRLSIAYGLTMIAAAASLPVMVIVVGVLCFSPIYVGVIVWYGFRLRREPSTA
jgi:hypothetical protein